MPCKICIYVKICQENGVILYKMQYAIQVYLSTSEKLVPEKDLPKIYPVLSVLWLEYMTMQDTQNTQSLHFAESNNLKKQCQNSV